jgi:hypothetical protein
MPFEALETIARDTRVPMASVSYARSQRKGKVRAGLPVLIIAIPTTLAGVCKRDRFRFEVGTGNDAGKARVCGLAKGTVGTSAPGTMMKNALVIRFGEVPALGEDAAAKEQVHVRKIDDNQWEIDLPPWFKVVKQPKVRAA